MSICNPNVVKGIFGIAGKARSGKTTAAMMIAAVLEEMGEKSQILPLADRIKGLIPQKPGESKEDWRPRLIEHGAFLNARYGKGYLVGMTLGNAEKGVWAIVPDLRRPEEYKALVNYPDTRMPPVVLRLFCPDDVRRYRFDDDPAKSTFLFDQYLERSSGDETESGLIDVQDGNIQDLDTSDSDITLGAICEIVGVMVEASRR